jgi:hypothetical protein
MVPDIGPGRAWTSETWEPGERGASEPLLLVAALDPGLLQQLAVLLLCHALAALLDD